MSSSGLIQIPFKTIHEKVSLGPVSPQFGLVLPKTPIPFQNPYITQKREISSFTIPFLLELAVTETDPSAPLPENIPFHLDLFIDNVLAYTTGVQIEKIKLGEESIFRMWMGTISADLTNPLVLTRSSSLSIGAHTVIPPTIPNAETNLVFYLNAILLGETKVQGPGAIFYQDVDL